LGVPHVKGRERFSVDSTASLAEQDISLSEDTIDALADGSEFRTDEFEGVVKVRPAFVRATFDKDKVVWGEDCDTKALEQLRGARDALAVLKGTISCRRPYFDFDQCRPIAFDHLAPDDRRIRPVPEERFSRAPPEGFKGGQIADRLEEARLPRAV
jgi:hypothetical protein